jgi:hypothetical protein
MIEAWTIVAEFSLRRIFIPRCSDSVDLGESCLIRD